MALITSFCHVFVKHHDVLIQCCKSFTLILYQRGLEEGPALNEKTNEKFLNSEIVKMSEKQAYRYSKPIKLSNQIKFLYEH